MAGVSSMFNKKKNITSTLNQSKKTNKTVAKPYYNLLTSFDWICDLKSVIQCINHNTITSSSELVAKITCGSIFVLNNLFEILFHKLQKIFHLYLQTIFFPKETHFFLSLFPQHFKHQCIDKVYIPKIRLRNECNR